MGASSDQKPEQPWPNPDRFVLSLILRVMESPMTRVFNLSELMVGGFGVSDPVTDRGD